MEAQLTCESKRTYLGEGTEGNRKAHLQGCDLLKAVGVPLLELLVLAGAEEEVGLGHKLQAHDAVVVGKHGAVAVAKVQAPDLDVAVGGPRDDQRAVLRGPRQEKGHRKGLMSQSDCDSIYLLIHQVATESLDSAASKTRAPSNQRSKQAS